MSFYRIKTILPLFAVILFPGLHNTLQAFPVQIQGQSVDTEKPDMDDLRPLSSRNRLILAQYYIDAARSSASLQKSVKQLIQKYSGFSEVERGSLNALAAAYFEVSPSSRQSTLQKEYANWTSKARSDVEREAVSLLQYHANLLRFSARGNGYNTLEPDCQLLGNAACDLVQSGKRMEASIAKKDIGSDDYRALQHSLDPVLFQKNPIPFMDVLARPLPTLLTRLGLPLEAAILSAGVARRQPKSDLAEKVSLYLTMAGDYRSALRYEQKNNAKPSRSDQLKYLDWLILAGQYAEAVELILKQKPDSLGAEKGRDVWVGLPRNGDVMRIRLAGLIYLDGDVKKAGQLLHEFIKKDPEGKRAETLIARLRIAQMVLSTDPELAHKLAEDVTYEAQERGLDLIEYQATVLDGWALFFLEKNYNALINFIKARGILHGEQRNVTPDFSRQAGMYFLKRRTSPGAIQVSEILSLSSYIAARRFDPADRFFLLWLPGMVDRHFLTDAFLRDLQTKQLTPQALLVLSRMSASSRFEFGPGNNPGGLRGLRTSIRESRFQNRFEWAGSGDPYSFIREEAYDLHKMELPGAESGRNVLFFAGDPESGNGHFVLFSAAGGRWRFFVQTMARTDGISLDCDFEDGGDCEKAIQFFTDFRDKVDGRLAVLYDPVLDLDYSRIFGSATVTYYGWPVASSKQKVHQYGINQFVSSLSDPCYDAGKRALPLDDFLSSDVKGRLLLPSSIDGKGQVYLREFRCKGQSLRLWDLDRRFRGDLSLVFWTPESQSDPAYRKELMRVFHDRGVPVLEAFEDPDDLLQSDHLAALVPGKYRIIFPGIAFLED